MPNQLQQIAIRWFDAFNTKNLEKLLELYDDEAQHFSPKLKVRQPETNGLIIGKEAIDETICDHSSRRKRNSYGKRHSQTIHRNSRQTDISPYDRKFLPIRSEYRFNNRTSSKPTRILETAMHSSPNHNSPSRCQGGRNTFSFGS